MHSSVDCMLVILYCITFCVSFNVKSCVFSGMYLFAGYIVGTGASLTKRFEVYCSDSLTPSLPAERMFERHDFNANPYAVVCHKRDHREQWE